MTDVPGHSTVNDTPPPRSQAGMGQDGDTRFEALYRAHARDVLAYCARRTSRDEASDAASEVFVVALRRIDDVPRGDEALPWLYAVAANVVRNRSRSERRRLRLTRKLSSRPQRSVAGPEPQVVRNEEHAELMQALEKLPEKDREVLRLVEWEGLSREQVADMMFVSRAAIDQRISRAYKRLGRTLGVPERDPSTAPVPAEEGGEA
ncbi:MAG: RNA polymerase sigma factor [Acidimicrobiia bacterium]